MRTPILVAFAAPALLLLAGCTAPGGSPAGPTDAAPDPDAPCIVGTWYLDVADYATQSEAYLVGTGIPITDFAMDGSGTITFTADGLVATTVDLTTSGTLVAGDVSVPVNQRSAYAGSGDWSEGAEPDTIDLANWANVPEDGVDVDPDVATPAIDYTGIPSVSASCSAHDLTLQGPEAPLSAHWTR
jgi:hypothetical protein